MSAYVLVTSKKISNGNLSITPLEIDLTGYTTDPTQRSYIKSYCESYFIGEDIIQITILRIL